MDGASPEPTSLQRHYYITVACLHKTKLGEAAAVANLAGFLWEGFSRSLLSPRVIQNEGLSQTIDACWKVESGE